MRTELDVPFSHKEEAKALGAKWDRTKKIWYVPSGVNPEPFAEWLPGVDRSDPSAPYIYLVLGKRECWKCHKETSVAAFGIPYRTDNDESIAIAHAPNEAARVRHGGCSVLSCQNFLKPGSAVRTSSSTITHAGWSGLPRLRKQNDRVNEVIFCE